MHQDVIQLRIEKLADDGPLGVTAHKHPRRCGLGVALGLQHPRQQGDQCGPHLLPDYCGHGASRNLGGLVRQLARQGAPAAPDTPLLLHPSSGLAPKDAETRGALTRHAAPGGQSKPARRAREKRRARASRSATSGGHSNPVTLSASRHATRVAPPRSRAHRPAGPHSSRCAMSCNCPGTRAGATPPAQSSQRGTALAARSQSAPGGGVSNGRHRRQRSWRPSHERRNDRRPCTQ